MKVLLLPGMDGTGQLFEPLLRAWPGDLAPTVMSLNHLSAGSYREQVAQLRGQLSAAPVVIVAESYSGPIAYALCRELGSRVAGVVFLASFVSRPCGVVRLARRLPAVSLRLDWLPDRLLNGIGFGGLGTASSMASVRLAVQDVAPAVLKQRLSNMAVLREPSERLSTPAVYIAQPVITWSARPLSIRSPGYFPRSGSFPWKAVISSRKASLMPAHGSFCSSYARTFLPLIARGIRRQTLGKRLNQYQMLCRNWL